MVLSRDNWKCVCREEIFIWWGGVSSIERVSLSIEVRLFFLLLLYILF